VTPVTVRRATIADLASVSALLTQYYNEWDIWQRDSESAVHEALSHPPLGYFLAEVDGEAAGCVLLKPLPSLSNAVECKRLFVAPGFRGRRLAGALMDAAEAAARKSGHQWLYLDSKVEFATAIALYQRRGYEEVPRYNDNPQATIFMRLALG
jgi:ribosomal protein S18 acetylase RimI-like enzyme